MTMTIGFIGAKGGSCTSTIAAATALRAYEIGMVDAPIVIHDREPDDQRCIFGPYEGNQLAPGIFLTTSSPLDPDLVIDVDTEAALLADLVVVCFRGPSYLALRRYLHASRPEIPGHAVAVIAADAGSALTHREVADVTGLEVLGTIPIRGVTMRALDAGVFAARGMTPEISVTIDRVLAEVTVSA